ncbi:Copper-exporting P-type ATPase B [bacterium HR34]|nr:Copper-exporting P-type ATPase B [bacterium HR34]
MAMFTCPMHPNIKKEDEGICPECGMRLVPSKEKPKEFNKHEDRKTNVFKLRLLVSLIFSIPIVFYSDVAQKLIGYTAPAFPFSNYLIFLLASIVFFYGGWVFMSSAFREIKAKAPGMMTLISLAIITAYVYSVYALVMGQEKVLFWELATLITIMLLGHWIEMKAVSHSQSALKELSKLLPDKAELIKDGKTQIVLVQDLKVGDIFLVRPGGKIPADGVVVEGESEINESIVTGESKPVLKKVGDEVIAGTINGDGALKVKVTKIGENTFLAGVMRLIAEAQVSKSRLQMLSDKAAFLLTVLAVIVGTASLIVWSIIADLSFAITRMVAVLVIACPHALGLAIPLVSAISTTKAAQNGFLIKRKSALELARKIDIILFDKTGTLTKGEFGVDKIISVRPDEENLVLQYAYSVNYKSEHPIAKAIVKEAQNRGLEKIDVKDFQRLPGIGVKGKVHEKEIFVGSEVLLEKFKIEKPQEIKKIISELSSQGKTIIFVIENNNLLGAIALMDIIREEAKEAIKQIHNMGIKTAMITGDSEDVAKWVAKELGIDEYFARVMPHEKSEKVKMLQQKGLKVAMVGDGVNDAPALTQADVGIAIGAGTNVALESADIILVRNDPRDIVKIIKLSKMTYSKMIQNIFWAAGYNIVAIPSAAGVLADNGVFLDPAISALLMSASTIIVAFNAALLRTKKL